MRSSAIAGVLLVCCTMASAQENAGKSDTSTPQNSGWFSNVRWSFGEEAAARRDAALGKKADSPVIETPEIRFKREEVFLNRRNEVILKLREIAQRTGDDALLKKTDDLQERAWDLFLQKTACPAGSTKEAPR